MFGFSPNQSIPGIRGIEFASTRYHHSLHWFFPNLLNLRQDPRSREVLGCSANKCHAIGKKASYHNAQTRRLGYSACNESYSTLRIGVLFSLGYYVSRRHSVYFRGVRG